MKRKYLPIEKYPEYNMWYNKFQVQSHILNGGQDTIPNVNTILWDKKNLEIQLILITGDSEGFCYSAGGNQRIAEIPTIKLQLDEIQINYKQFQRQRQNSGYEKPTEMPKEYVSQFYKLEAKLSILQGEKEAIEMGLKQLENAVQKKDDNAVLEYGLSCSFHFHGLRAENPELINVMKVIDGQSVSQMPDGMLYIDDSNSPYDGLSIPDYRKLSKIWHTDRLQADADLLLKMQQEAKEKGETRPRTTGRNLSAKVYRSTLPKFPEWAKNYKAKVETPIVEYKSGSKYPNQKNLQKTPKV